MIKDVHAQATRRAHERGSPRLDGIRDMCLGRGRVLMDGKRSIRGTEIENPVRRESQRTNGVVNALSTILDLVQVFMIPAIPEDDDERAKPIARG